MQLGVTTNAGLYDGSIMLRQYEYNCYDKRIYTRTRTRALKELAMDSVFNSLRTSWDRDAPDGDDACIMKYCRQSSHVQWSYEWAHAIQLYNNCFDYTTIWFKYLIIMIMFCLQLMIIARYCAMMVRLRRSTSTACACWCLHMHVNCYIYDHDQKGQHMHTTTKLLRYRWHDKY